MRGSTPHPLPAPRRAPSVPPLQPTHLQNLAVTHCRDELCVCMGGGEGGGYVSVEWWVSWARLGRVLGRDEFGVSRPGWRW
jgi:hypothetical protein